MTRVLVGGTDQVQLPPDSSGKRSGFIKTSIGGVGTELYLPSSCLVDDAGNTLDSAIANLAATGTERGLVVRTAGAVSVRGTLLPIQTLAVTAATPVTGTGLAVADAGNATWIVKNTVAATAYTGAPVLVFEQSDDNVSWGPLSVQRSDTGLVASTHTLPAGSANGSLMFDAGLEGVNFVRVRVTTAQSANGMTIVTQPGGLPFSPAVGLNGPTVKAASATVAATDQQLAVGLHPNSNPMKVWDGSNPVSIGTPANGGGMSVRGAQLTGQTLNVTAATPVTGTGLAVADAGNCTFIVKNTVAATAWTGTPQILFEQSDDNVSWGPLAVTRADTGYTATLHSPPAPSANGELMYNAALPGVNFVRVRVTVAQATNGMTIITQPGGMPFQPSVSDATQPWRITKVLAAATTNASFSKATTGWVGGWYVYNNAAATRYVRLYNKASAPTVGTDSPAMVIAVPAGAAANQEFSDGIEFSLGIAHAITAAIADLDATACAASDVLLNLFWR